MRDLNLSPPSDGHKSAKGRSTKSIILKAALEIFIEHGYGEFSIQKVAARCSLSRGNVSYHYPTRDDLLHGMVDAVLQGYIDDFDDISKDAGLSAAEKFVSIIEMIMSDLGTKETSVFFPELWALSNHNAYALAELNKMYQRARAHLIELIGAINPALSKTDRELVGVFISASIEGHTPFVGPGKEWEKSLPKLTNIAAYSFLHLAKSVTKNDIAAMRKGLKLAS
jgi:AcrR family transcriptional regulator